MASKLNCAHFDVCGAKVHAKGLCNSHYRSLTRYGDALAVGQRMAANDNIRNRILRAVNRKEDVTLSRITGTMSRTFDSEAVGAELKEMISEGVIMLVGSIYSEYRPDPMAFMRKAWTPAGMAGAR